MEALKIENQAMMFAYLCRSAVQKEGEAGRAAIREGMKRYGRERGRRMAGRAAANGDPIDLASNQAYGEWKPDYPGQMEFGYAECEPVLVSYISKCAWCDAWKKYDILEYGREYCVNVDAAVYEGFNLEGGSPGEEIPVCTPLTVSMSWGGERCDFDWGRPLTEEDRKWVADRKASLGTSAMKDFTYHTAHIYYTISRTLKELLPNNADDIISEAVRDYAGTFGEAAFDVLAEYENEEF